MGKSKVQVIKTIHFGKEEYSLSYQISDEFDSDRTRKIIGLCEYAIMRSWCKYKNVSGIFDGHWLPYNKNVSVTFTGCPIDAVREAAEIILRIIDADKIEEVIIDERDKSTRKENHYN